MKFFEPHKKQLVFIQQTANADFWDKHWHTDNSVRDKIINCKNTFASRITAKYLRPEAGPILEGGCGQAQNVAALYNNGYQVIGLDYAPKTIEMLNKFVPELDIRLGDVRKLPFADDFFAGYWSLGVIEHFWNGYREIAKEMARVIKPQGYLFLTFPYMSPLRKFKAKANLYPQWSDANLKDDFYQLALNSQSVINDFHQLEFKLVHTKPFDGLKGTKDEIDWLKPSLQRLYDYQGKFSFVRYFRKILSLILSPFFGHCILLIFQNNKKS